MAEKDAAESSKEKGTESSRSRAYELSRQSLSPGPRAHILNMQQSIGNRAVCQLLQSGASPSEMQEKGLTISRPGDALEHEADRVAERMGHSNETHDSKVASGQEARPLGVADASFTKSTGPAQQLPADVQHQFEPQLGYDLSHVRIHTGQQAAESASAINAAAYTVGQDIVFGANQYAPETNAGKRLIAHELAHVMQQAQQRNSFAPSNHFTSQLSSAVGVVQRQKGSGTEDWDFTPADYGQLVKNKGALKISSDSSWFPAQLQTNLLNTLKALLDLKRKPSATEGVNVKDLYHGHVALTKKAGRRVLPESVEKKKAEYEKKREEAYKPVGGKYTTPTEKNIKEYTKAEEASLPAAGEVLKEALKSEGLVVIYHTFEWREPSDLKAKGQTLGVSDPRRNYITPLDTNQPVPYKPPDPKKASSWEQDFSDVMQFSFLVDQTGEVHIRTGTTTQLSSVTGKPER